MFSPIVPLNRNASCGTIPICERSDDARDVAQVVPVDQDAAGGRVVEARDELGERRLAGAGRADQRDGLARRDAQVDVAQRVRSPSAAVGERHVVEVDLAAQRRGSSIASGASTRSGSSSSSSKILSSAAMPDW